jgi:hypothetical protein
MLGGDVVGALPARVAIVKMCFYVGSLIPGHLPGVVTIEVVLGEVGHWDDPAK